MFLRNRNIISKIKVSKFTDYAALNEDQDRIEWIGMHFKRKWFPSSIPMHSVVFNTKITNQDWKRYIFYSFHEWQSFWYSIRSSMVTSAPTTHHDMPGRQAQSVTCLTTDASLSAGFDPGPVPYFRGDWSTVIPLPSAEPFKSYKRKYVHKVLVNCLFKLTQEKVWLGELTVPPWP